MLYICRRSCSKKYPTYNIIIITKIRSILLLSPLSPNFHCGFQNRFLMLSSNLRFATTVVSSKIFPDRNSGYVYYFLMEFHHSWFNHSENIWRENISCLLVETGSFSYQIHTLSALWFSNAFEFCSCLLQKWDQVSHTYKGTRRRIDYFSYNC
jgi:hypothetical protein